MRAYSGAVHAAATTIQRLAHRMQTSELDVLTQQAFRLVIGATPQYLGASLTETELRSTIRGNLDQLLGALAHQGTEALDDAWTTLAETGRRRAQQRVPLESLLRSFRIGGRVLWEGMIHAAAGHEGDLSRLLNDAGVVWEVVDRGSEVVTRAYRDEQLRLELLVQRRREVLLGNLLDGRPPASGGLSDAGRVLSMPVDSSYVVVVRKVGPTDLDPIPEVEAILTSVGLASAWVSRGSRDIGVIAVSARTGTRGVQEALAARLPGPAALSPLVSSLGGIADGHRLAELAVRTLAPDSTALVQATDRLPHALLIGMPDVAEVLVAHSLGPILALAPVERDVLLTTIEAFVEHHGSHVATARHLACHRNTVIRRMHRIEALIQRSMTETGLLFDLYLAVLALRQQPSAPPASP